MTLIGLAVTFLGFAIAFSSLGVTDSTSTRMVMVLAGIVVSLVGIMGVLTPAYQKKWIYKKFVIALALLGCLAHAEAARAQAPAAAAAVAITDADLKAAVKPTDRANGDPDGSLTGTANDIAVADPKAGLTVADVLNQIGANRIGVNLAWTLLCGFLIMFMQAGFAVVEAGLC